MECNASLFQVPNIISNYVYMYFVSVYTLPIFNNFNIDLGNSFTAMIIALPWIPRSRRRAWDSWKTTDHSWKMSIQIESTHAIAIRIKPLHIYRVICRLAPSMHLLSWREQQSPAATEVPLSSSPGLSVWNFTYSYSFGVELYRPCLIVCRESKSQIVSLLNFSIFHISHSSYLSPFLSTYLSISRCFYRIEPRSIDKQRHDQSINTNTHVPYHISHDAPGIAPIRYPLLGANQDCRLIVQTTE